MFFFKKKNTAQDEYFCWINQQIIMLFGLIMQENKKLPFVKVYTVYKT